MSESVEVIMPAMEAGQTTATLVHWLAEEGTLVEEGTPIMEIETGKITVEIEAPATGILSSIRAVDGDEVPVGETVATIEVD